MSKAVRLRGVDLNLLPVLRELLRARNVSRVAETLGMSQSAVSEALKRLRFQFDDEILVRVGRSMTPTQFALSLVAPVEQMLARIEALLDPPDFDLLGLNRQFVVATADTIVLAIAAPLMARLTEIAPNVSVQFVDLQWVDPRSLDTALLDLAILPKQIFRDTSLRSFLVYEEDFVLIARKGGSAGERPLTRERLSELTTIAFRADPHSRLTTTIGSKFDQMRMPQFLPQPFLVQDSDTVALVPRLLALRFAQLLDLEILEPPLELPTVEVRAFWSGRHENDPSHRWFRGLLQDIASELAG